MGERVVTRKVSQTKYSNTSVRALFVWIMSCEVIILAWVYFVQFVAGVFVPGFGIGLPPGILT